MKRNSYYPLISLILTLMICAPKSGWAGANPNAPYCEHDPACWIPNDDPSTWYGADCCRPVENEPCVVPGLPAGHTGSMIEGGQSGSYNKGPIISMAGTVRTWYIGHWKATAVVTKSAHAKEEFATNCGEGYVNAVRVNPQTVPINVTFGVAFPFDKFGFATLSASAEIFSHTFSWGGKNRPLIIQPAKCRHHCGKGWEIYAKPCIRVQSRMWTKWVELGPGGSIRRRGEFETVHDDVTCKDRKIYDFVWNYTTATCPEP